MTMMEQMPLAEVKNRLSEVVDLVAENANGDASLHNGQHAFGERERIPGENVVVRGEQCRSGRRQHAGWLGDVLAAFASAGWSGNASHDYRGGNSAG